LLWYARNIEELKVHKLFRERTDEEVRAVFPRIDPEGRRFKASDFSSRSSEEIARLRAAERLTIENRAMMFPHDFPVTEIHNVWDDTVFGHAKAKEKVYAVQTNTKVVERCILMTTDPGDLVFDPTCGSGTTAYCAEKWGRRWITCDTSRVALAIARQRLMTAKFDYYELAEPERGPAGGFIYETVPHITLESIAKNTEIDEIAAKYQPEIDQALANLNEALGKNWKEWEVPREIPNPVWSEEAKQAYWRLLKLKDSLQPEDRQEAERLLKVIYQQTGHRWTLKEIPEPVPPEGWSDEAKEALRRFWGTEAKEAPRD
jgi:adenine-specific DNA-methyltransferase